MERDPESTRERILRAALQEFSAKGISGARVDSIAALAKANKSLLYYYFGSKEALFREVLGQPLTVSSERLRSPSVRSADRLVQRSEDHPPDTQYVRLLAWEGLQSDCVESIADDPRRAFFEAWVAAVEAEQRAGRLPDTLDASQLVLSEVLLVLGPRILPQLVRLITGLTIDDPEFLKSRREFLREVTRRLDDMGNTGDDQ